MDNHYPYEFMREAAIHVPKPCEFIGKVVIHVPKPCEFIGEVTIHGPKPYEFTGKLKPMATKPVQFKGEIVIHKPKNIFFSRRASAQASTRHRVLSRMPKTDYGVLTERLRKKLSADRKAQEKNTAQSKKQASFRRKKNKDTMAGKPSRHAITH